MRFSRRSRHWEFAARDTSARSIQEIEQISKWLTKKYPMTVQKALFYDGELPDPFVGLNAQKHEWVEQKIRYFKKKFQLPTEKKNAYIFLSFDGLDYYSRVWVNGTHLGRHEGMFGGPGTEPFFTLGFWRGARMDCVPKTHWERPYIVTVKTLETTTEHDALYLLTTCTLRVTNAGNTFAPVVWLELDAPNTTFCSSDNFFSLETGEKRTLAVRVRENPRSEDVSDERSKYS